MIKSEATKRDEAFTDVQFNIPDEKVPNGSVPNGKLPNGKLPNGTHSAAKPEAEPSESAADAEASPSGKPPLGRTSEAGDASNWTDEQELALVRPWPRHSLVAVVWKALRMDPIGSSVGNEERSSFSLL